MSLIGYWNFNSNVLDTSGNSNNLTLDSGLGYTTGIKGNGVLFNDSTKSAFAASTVCDITTEDFSISFWFKRLVDTGSIETLVRKRQGGQPGYSIVITSTDFISIVIRSVSAGSDTGINLPSGILSVGSWYFFVVTFDRDGNGTGYLYNSSGSLVTSNISSITSQQSSMSNSRLFMIGKNQALSTESFNGVIDELRFHNHVLSTNEISGIYNYGLFTGHKTKTLKLPNKTIKVRTKRNNI